MKIPTQTPFIFVIFFSDIGLCIYPAETKSLENQFLQKNFTKKIVVFNKMSCKTKFRLKIKKFIVNFKKKL